MNFWLGVREAWRRAQLTADERNAIEAREAELRRRAATSEVLKNIVFTGAHMPRASVDPAAGIGWEQWASRTVRDEGPPIWESDEAPMGFRKEDWPRVREELKHWRGGPPPAGPPLFRRTRSPATIEFGTPPRRRGRAR